MTMGFQKAPTRLSTLSDAEAEKITLQVELEQLYNKNQLISRIRKEFVECKEFDFIDHMTHMGIPIEFGLDVLIQMALHKRASLPTLAGILRLHFNDCQITADMLLKCTMADLVDWDAKTEHFIVKFEVSADIQEELDRFQYPLPMVIEPKKVKKNTDTGYILGGGSLILKHNHHEDDICLDHINRMNRVRFAIDHETARMVKNRWRNLDKQKAGETKAEFEKRRKMFEKYDRTAKDVITALSIHTDCFYLTHKYDKRGRVYCQGYHINYQGAPWNKAIIQLAEKELVE